LKSIIEVCNVNEMISMDNLQTIMPHYSKEILEIKESKSNAGDAVDVKTLLDRIVSSTNFANQLIALEQVKIVFTQTYNDTSLLELIAGLLDRSVIMDYLHIHGLIPHIMSHLLRLMRDLLINLELGSDNSLRMYADDTFSNLFALLFLIMERFDIAKIKENKTKFKETIGEVHEITEQTSPLMQWFVHYLMDYSVVYRDNNVDMHDQANEIMTFLASNAQMNFIPSQVLLATPVIVQTMLYMHLYKIGNWQTVLGYLNALTQHFPYMQINIAINMHLQLPLMHDIDKNEAYSLVQSFYNNCAGQRTSAYLISGPIYSLICKLKFHNLSQQQQQEVTHNDAFIQQVLHHLLQVHRYDGQISTQINTNIPVASGTTINAQSLPSAVIPVKMLDLTNTSENNHISNFFSYYFKQYIQIMDSTILTSSSSTTSSLPATASFTPFIVSALMKLYMAIGPLHYFKLMWSEVQQHCKAIVNNEQQQLLVCELADTLLAQVAYEADVANILQDLVPELLIQQCPDDITAKLFAHFVLYTFTGVRKPVDDAYTGKPLVMHTLITYADYAEHVTAHPCSTFAREFLKGFGAVPSFVKKAMSSIALEYSDKTRLLELCSCKHASLYKDLFVSNKEKLNTLCPLYDDDDVQL